MNEMSQSLRFRLQMPEEMAAKIQAIGKQFSPEIIETTKAMYAEILKDVRWEGITVEKDKAYGSHERQCLDVHVPAEKGTGGLPTVIFFHGGGMIQGHKNEVGDLIYGNVANVFAANSIIGVNATYRLAPESRWPAGAEDVGGALAWVRANIASFGGDPEKVFIMGQSAGAIHVAAYAFQSRFHPADGPGFAGAILMSGTYTIDRQNLAPNRIAYYGDDPSKYDEQEILTNITYSDFPVMITVGELETTPFERSAFQLSAKLIDLNGHAPHFKQLWGHNHVSQIFCFGTEDQTVSADMVEFVKQTV